MPFNNAAERGLRGIALGRKSWLFAGSDRGGERYSLIVTAKLNDIDPQAWLADVLGRIAGQPVSRLDELLRGAGSPLAPPSAAQPEDRSPCGSHRMLTFDRLGGR